MDPKRITNALGIAPTNSKVKGEKIMSPRGTERIVKKGYWEWKIKKDCADSEEERDDAGMLVQLDRLVSEFGVTFCNVMPILSSQLNCDYSWIDIHVIADQDDSSVSFPLSVESMKILSETRLLVNFTVTN